MNKPELELILNPCADSTAHSGLSDEKMAKETKEKKTVTPEKTQVPTITTATTEQARVVGRTVQFLEISNVKLRLRDEKGSLQLTLSVQATTARTHKLFWTKEQILSTHSDVTEATIAFVKRAHQITTELSSGLQ